MLKKISSRTKAILLAAISMLILGNLPELHSAEVYPEFLNSYHFKNLQFYNLYSQLPMIYFMLYGNTPNLEIEQDTTDIEIYNPVFLKQTPIRRFDLENPKYQQTNSMMPETYNKVYQIDSSLNKLTTKHLIDSTLINEPYDISTDNFLKIRKKNLEAQIWDSLVSEYDLKKAFSQGDLTKMLNAATGLTIPLPPNPVLNIFGKPQININVQGELNIRAGWRWDSQNLGSVSQFGQTQSSPVFSQDIKLIISGGIGDKLKLSTDWNTRRYTEFENKFKIGYEGEDDEIIKLIEIGNVSLPTQSTLISGSQSLFGVRADFQFGPLFIKTIASQKRGEKKTMSVTGGSSKQPFSIHAYDYAKNNFFVDSAYYKLYDDYYKAGVFGSYPNTPEASYYRIKGDLEVWEASSDPLNNPVSAKSVAVANLPGKKTMQGERYDDNIKKAYALAGEIERGNFMKLDSSRYKVDRNLGTVTIYSMRTDRYYAVSYRIEGPTAAPEDDIYYGTLSADSKTGIDTLVLKLIYRPNLQPGFKTLWDRQMKNIYSINSSNVNTNDTKIGLWYYNQTNDSTDVLPDAKDKLVTIFNVDKSDNAGSGQPDGQFDMRMPFFNAQRGEITFPSRKPFVDGIIAYFDKMGTPQLADKYIYRDVYDTTYDVAKLNTGRDRFVISGEVTGKATNRIPLGYMNLAQNSVKVYLDGVELKEYQDFLVDTYSGIVTLLNPRASLPNANLRIEFEQQDIFNISTKTLLGLRADYQLFKTRTLNTSLGFTIMNYDQSSAQERARLGEEPLANTMIGFDMKTNLETPWLTKALDYLPFYDTKAPSSLAVKGEWAVTIPTPNKRESDVISDNGKPVVYIDDFEGSQRYIPLGMSALQWTHASPPKDPSIDPDSSIVPLFRGKTQWYQYAYPRIPIKEPYPDRETQQGNSNISGFYFKFDPDIRGIYNKNPEFLDSINPNFDVNNQFSRNPANRKKIWGGFMRLLSAFNTNFDTDNIEFIDIMMRIDHCEFGKTKMYIDLGQISEDVIFNGALDTEDGITEANKIPNNIIDPGEDVGIDGMNDAAEKERGYPYPLNLENDPARDNYRFDFNSDDDKRDEYSFGDYNNYENSAVSEGGQFPDTEILNKNNGQSLSTADDYFTYEVNLDPNPTNNPQIVGGNEDKGWFLYRIPIRKPIRKVGNPLFSNVQYVRVRFQGGNFKATIADWRLIGSYWQRINNIQSGVNSDDSTMQVSFVNVEENSGAPVYYTMPPGVKAPTKYNSDPNKEVKVNEQSLSLSVKNLKYGEERLAVRYFRQMDMFYYKYLKFFVHGDGSMPVENEKPKAYSFIRFGIDSMNYYEYKMPLFRGWQNIEIDRDQLTAIKQLRDSLGTLVRKEYPVPGNTSAIFAVKGNPVLTKVQFVGFGIYNSSNQYPNELTTTMWVDELRLLSPEEKADWAAVASADLKLADLATINANIQHTTPNFHKLEERFGNRTNSTNWSVTVTGNADKFAPASFKEMKIPVSYTHSEVAQSPDYMANSDVKVEEAAQAAYRNARTSGYTEQEAQNIADATRKRSQTVRVSDSWAIQGFKFGLPINSWLIKETINRLVMSYSYNQEWERNPNVEERFNWNWRFNAQYSLNIPAIATVSPLSGVSKEAFMIGTYNEWKLNFLPTTFASTLSMNRSRITEKSRYLSVPSPVIRNFAVERTSEFSWKISENGLINPTIDYKTNTTSTLVPWELDENGRQRSGSELTKQILFNDGKLLNLGSDNLHNQMFTLKVAPRLPIGYTLSKLIDMSGSFMTSYNWTNAMNTDPELSDKAKNANYNNTINFKLGFKLRQLGDMILGGSVAPPPVPSKKGSKDTTQTPALSPNGGVLGVIRDVFKTILFDYEKFDITFNQTNASANPGVFGGSGYTNFWRGAIGLNNADVWGPNALYQLGLISNPHGGVNVTSSDKFPYFGFDAYPGLRPPNGVFQDNFNQKSTLEARTSRPLWKGATLDLNWGTDLGYNRNQTVITDSLGVPKFTNVLAMESFSRTFLSMPSFFGLNLFNNNIDHVIELYRTAEQQIDRETADTILANRKKLNALADAFHDGLEAFSIFGGKIGKFLPAINWKITWEGIEKWDLWGDWVKKASFEHSYQSKYTEAVQITDNGRSVQSQQVQTGFTPLIGVNVTLNEKKTDGIVTAQFKWNSTNAYSVAASNRASISRQSTEEIQLQAGYTMKGFEFPLFGIILKNDLEVSLLTSFKMNKRATYDVMNDNNSKDGSTLDGNKQVVVEPRATYSISNKVRASAFFRYEGTFNEGAGSPGFTTTQVGIDLRVSLSGGR